MKTLKVVLVIIFLMGVFQNAFSQQIKTYQGKYEGGNAVYQYFDDENYERIKQGNFKYTAESVTVIGKYDKNQRVGRWSINKTPKEMTMFNQVIGGYNEIVTGNYINGDMDGLWTLKRINVKTKKTVINSQVYFKEGYLVNSFKYYNAKFPWRNSETELSLIGNFDSKSNFDSTWVASYTEDKIPFEDIRKFKDGSLYFQLLRNLSTGEIIKEYYDSDEIYSSVFEEWERIKTPNSYDFENPIVHVRSSDEELLKLFR